jgi:hypothetical protein
MAHGDAREGKWRGNWRMERVVCTLHTTSKHGVSSITTADAHTSAARSRLNWRPNRFKWTRPFRRKTKYGFCACATTFQTQSTRSGLISAAQFERAVPFPDVVLIHVHALYDNYTRQYQKMQNFLSHGTMVQRWGGPPKSRGFYNTHNDAPQSVGLL